MQGGHADGIKLRLRGRGHRSRAVGQHRRAPRQEAPVGRHEHAVPQRAGSGQVPARRTAQGMGRLTIVQMRLA